jgi:outer membrane protein assembly factor BamB
LTAEELKAPDDSSWPSFRATPNLTGAVTSSLPAKLELLWQVELGEQIVASAAIVGDHVYVPCLSGEIVCLERRTGNRLWTYKSVEKVEKNTFAPGFKSSPLVTADSVYAGDEDGVFHAIDRRTGQGRWKVTTGGEIFSSAASANGRILFGSYDNSLYCLDESNGEVKWKFPTDGYVHCAPAISDGHTFIAGCDEHLRVINIESGQQAADIPLQTYLIASPAVIGNMLYVGTYSSEVVAVDWKDKKTVWRYQAGDGEFPFHSSAALTDKAVVVGGRDKLVHAINRATGKKLWTFPTRAKVDSSPAIVGNRVFIGSNDGNLYELTLADGKEVWKFNAGKPISAGPAIGSDVLVVGSESRDGKVYCFGKK